MSGRNNLLATVGMRVAAFRALVIATAISIFVTMFILAGGLVVMGTAAAAL